MGKIQLYKDQASYVTDVPNIFIDRYMTRANGEYVKVFLYLLRCMNKPQADFSITGFADHFDYTESDVLRALRYWEKGKLLRLEYDSDNALSGICILEEAFLPDRVAETEAALDRSAYASASMPVRTDALPESKTREYSPAEISRFCEESDIAEMIFVSEQYLGRNLSPTDLNHIFYWYDQLHFSVDLIEYLIEHCVSREHTSFYYMNRIAEDLASRNIQDVDVAKEALRQSSEIYQTVFRAFGIRGRSITPVEQEYITRWSDVMGFSLEMIEEACKRTIQSAHEPSFPYADSILKNWKKKGITTLVAVRKSDELFRKEKQGREQAAAKSANTVKPTNFSNFRQRNTDYDALEQELIKRSMQ